jgi:hypothetical protein
LTACGQKPVKIKTESWYSQRPVFLIWWFLTRIRELPMAASNPIIHPNNYQYSHNQDVNFRNSTFAPKFSATELQLTKIPSIWYTIHLRGGWRKYGVECYCFTL